MQTDRCDKIELRAPTICYCQALHADMKTGIYMPEKKI